MNARPAPNEEVIHTSTSIRYKVLSVGVLAKIGEGEWVESVIYCKADNQLAVFVRDRDTFMKTFEEALFEYGDDGGKYPCVESTSGEVLGEFVMSEQDARFIAAANPQVIGSLIDRLRKAEAVSKWISVKDRLPTEDGLLVEVFDPENEPTVWPAKWDAENRSFSSNGGWFEADEITHWQPLPAAPDSAESAEKDDA